MQASARRLAAPRCSASARTEAAADHLEQYRCGEAAAVGAERVRRAGRRRARTPGPAGRGGAAQRRRGLAGRPGRVAGEQHADAGGRAGVGERGEPGQFRGGAAPRWRPPAAVTGSGLPCCAARACCSAASSSAATSSSLVAGGPAHRRRAVVAAAEGGAECGGVDAGDPDRPAGAVASSRRTTARSSAGDPGVPGVGVEGQVGPPPSGRPAPGTDRPRWSPRRSGPRPVAVSGGRPGWGGQGVAEAGQPGHVPAGGDGRADAAVRPGPGGLVQVRAGRRWAVTACSYADASLPTRPPNRVHAPA